MKPYEFSARQLRDEGPSLSDDFIRQVLGNPKTGPKAVLQASYSARALESDRDLYGDLMRQRQQKQAELDQIERALEELDVQRILEKRS
jgi:hypothetical protein